MTAIEIVRHCAADHGATFSGSESAACIASSVTFDASVAQIIARLALAHSADVEIARADGSRGRLDMEIHTPL